jgi:hypothetical protein
VRIDSDVVSEGRRLLALAEAEDVPLRLLGGVAIRLRAAGEHPAAFSRSYADLDFATTRKASGRVSELFRREGYTPQTAFNALHGGERLLFFDDEHDRQVDVFVGSFAMCQKIPLEERLGVDAVSIPLAELLLTKLQVIELNEKDIRDTLALLHDHPVGDADGETLNGARVAALCAADWGLWRTITQNLGVCRAFAESYEIPDPPRVYGRIDELLDRIDREPKSRAWKLRAKIGDRKRWYQLPEEVAGGP